VVGGGGEREEDKSASMHYYRHLKRRVPSRGLCIICVSILQKPGRNFKCRKKNLLFLSKPVVKSHIFYPTCSFWRDFLAPVHYVWPCALTDMSNHVFLQAASDAVYRAGES
jgi:hypothetical protein